MTRRGPEARGPVSGRASRWLLGVALAIGLGKLAVRGVSALVRLWAARRRAVRVFRRELLGQGLPEWVVGQLAAEYAGLGFPRWLLSRRLGDYNQTHGRTRARHAEGRRD
jgi:hypothetical protein